jgi:hypothetical protein
VFSTKNRDLDPTLSNQETQFHPNGEPYLSGFANYITNLLEPGQEITIDLYVNTYSPQEFFQGSRYQPPKQFSMTPTWSQNLTYESMAYDDFPSFNVSLTKQQLDRITAKNKTLFAHMQTRAACHMGDPSTENRRFRYVQEKAPFLEFPSILYFN